MENKIERWLEIVTEISALNSKISSLTEERNSMGDYIECYECDKLHGISKEVPEGWASIHCYDDCCTWYFCPDHVREAETSFPRCRNDR